MGEMAALEAQSQQRQRWFTKADEAYKLVGQARSTVGLYLTRPFAGTATSEAAVQVALEHLRLAEVELRKAYRAEATAGTTLQEDDRAS